MLLRLIRSDTVIAEVLYTGNSCTIGSDPLCQLCTPDPDLPTEIATISGLASAPQLRVADCSIQIFLNGEELSAPSNLSAGDAIILADFTLEVLAPPAPETETEDEDLPQETAEAQPRSSVERLTKFVATQLPPSSITRKLDEAVNLEEGQMTIINAIVQTLSGAESVEGAMDLALQVLLSQFHAQRAWVGVRRVNYGPMDYVAGQLVTGQTTELTEWGENLMPRVLDRSQFVGIPRISREDRTSIMAGPIPGGDGLLGMVYVDRDNARGPYTSLELDLFSVVIYLIGAQVEAILNQNAKNRSAMIAGEVSVTRAIQARLTPRKLPVWAESLQFSAFREPGKQHANNIYDIVKLANGMALFMVAHTPAIGWAPCMLISNAVAAFRYSAMHLNAPHILLKTLNWILCDGQRDHDLCMFVGVIDPNAGKMQYSVAGRTPAFIIGPRGDERTLMPEQIPQALGVDRATEFPQLAAHFEQNETLAIFTPGVNATQNRSGETLGEERLLETLCDGFGQSASVLMKDIFSEVQAFASDGQQPEDMTFLLVHRPESDS